MWEVNSPPSARKPMTSTAPGVVLRTADKSQLPRNATTERLVVNGRLSQTAPAIAVDPDREVLMPTVPSARPRADPPGPSSRREHLLQPELCDPRDLWLPSASSSIECVGMDDLHQLMVVPVVHGDPDEHRPVHLERSLERGRDLIWRVDPQPPGAKGLGESDDVHRTTIHARRAAVLGHFLETDHVVRPVD